MTNCASVKFPVIPLNMKLLILSLGSHLKTMRYSSPLSLHAVYVTEFLLLLGSCLQKLASKQYTESDLKAYFNLIALDIYFKTLNVHAITETPKYSVMIRPSMKCCLITPCTFNSC